MRLVIVMLSWGMRAAERTLAASGLLAPVPPRSGMLANVSTGPQSLSVQSRGPLGASSLCPKTAILWTATVRVFSHFLKRKAKSNLR